MNSKIVRVGVGAIVRKDRRVLLGKRKGSHGEGYWAFPGGHLEFGESFEDCAAREVMEETSLVVKNTRFAALTNDIFEQENKHYITVFMLCDYKSGVVRNVESHKCEKWEWFTWNKLPAPLFIPIQNLQKQEFDPFNSIQDTRT